MSELHIITNGHARDILYWYELTEGERAEFDHYDAADSIFARYRGEIYDIGDFMRIDNRNHILPQFAGWHGYQSDSFFSGVLVRFPDDPYDTDHVVMGWYCC